jgi:hypothetical protein
MYDIQRLQQLLPFCKKIDIEAHDDQANGTRKVYVICNYTNGLVATLECPGMPADTQAMAELVVAGACQALAAAAVAGKFEYRKNKREVRRAGDDGKPWASCKPIPFCSVPEAPPIRQVKLTQADVIDVDGVPSVSSDMAQNRGPSSLEVSKARVKQLPPPPPEKLDKEKATRATEAMRKLLAEVSDE